MDFNIVKQDINEGVFVIPSLELRGITGEKDSSKFLMGKKDFIGFLIEVFEKK